MKTMTFTSTTSDYTVKEKKTTPTENVYGIQNETDDTDMSPSSSAKEQLWDTLHTH